MEAMLKPALAAIERASSADEVMAALVEAYPKMDSTGLEKLLQQAFFVSDLVGRHGAATEAAEGD
jgi:phage gp29-like protein